MSEKMDVYSDHRVPFDIATYCRGHKFAPAVVDLARRLRKIQDLRDQQASIETRLELEEHECTRDVAALRRKMEATRGI